MNGTGTCKFGLKKRQLVLDIYKDVANGDVWKFRNFAVFLTNALLLAQFHTGACLPAEETSCTDAHTDPVLAKISNDQQKPSTKRLTTYRELRTVLMNYSVNTSMRGF